MTDSDRHDHEEKADELERELDVMHERSGKLGEDIEGAGEDWEQKKRDPGVPGAPEEGASGDEEPGGEDDVPEEDLDFGREIDTEDVVVEDGPPADDDSKNDDDEDDDEDDSKDDADEDDSKDDAEDDDSSDADEDESEGDEDEDR